MTIVSTSYKLHVNTARIVHDKEYDYLEGCVITSKGIVSVYSQGDKINNSFSIFQIVHNKRLYTKRINKRYTVRGLATVAGRFAKEICE